MKTQLLGTPCLALCLILALSACESTPSGLPPAGAIIEDFKGKPELPKPDQAVNKMATDMTMKLVSLPCANRPPAVSLSGKDDSGLGAELYKTLKKSKLVREPAQGETPEYDIGSEIIAKDGLWRAGIRSADGQRLIWGQVVNIDMQSLQPAAQE